MMIRKLTLTACLVAFAMLLGATGAEAITITFMENGASYTHPEYWQDLSLSATEFAAQGILLTNVYQYGDARDYNVGYDGVGIAPPATGIIDFIVPTHAVTFDWWFELSQFTGGGTVYVNAYNASDVLLDSFSYTGSGLVSGTDTLTGTLISEIRFYDSTASAFPAISTLSFEPIPEPATMLILGGLGAGLVGAGKLRRKK